MFVRKSNILCSLEEEELTKTRDVALQGMLGTAWEKGWISPAERTYQWDAKLQEKVSSYPSAPSQQTNKPKSNKTTKPNKKTRPKKPPKSPNPHNLFIVLPQETPARSDRLTDWTGQHCKITFSKEVMLENKSAHRGQSAGIVCTDTVPLEKNHKCHMALGPLWHVTNINGQKKGSFCSFPSERPFQASLSLKEKEQSIALLESM